MEIQENPDDPAHENFNLCFDHNYLKEPLKIVYSSCMHLLWDGQGDNECKSLENI